MARFLRILIVSLVATIGSCRHPQTPPQSPDSSMDSQYVRRSNFDTVIVFVHGVFVVRGFLKRYQSRASQVQLVSFFSTPTAGAHVARLAQFLTKNPQMKGLLPADSESYVSDLERDWRALPQHVYSRCAYETLNTYGIRIVDEQSASSLCDGPVDPIARNHIDMVKPENQQDIVYLSFRRAYLDSLNSAQSGPQGPALITGVVPTARSVNVDCGQIRESTAMIPPPIEIRPNEQILDAFASLQQASNLKEEEVEARGLDHLNARVHYRLVGLDRRADGGCPGKGVGVILISFVVSRPAGLPAQSFFSLDSGPAFAYLAAHDGTLAFTGNKVFPLIEEVDAGPSMALRRDQLRIASRFNNAMY